jgi:asparagine synthase (glutamine-hydrolysing)
MSHALELRVPFVDSEVVRAAMGLDERLLLRRGTSKPALVGAVEHLLPREVWNRPKQGFTLPFDVWLGGVLRATVASELSPDQAARVGLKHDAVRAAWSDYRAGRGGMTWTRPWALYTLLRWAREHDVAVPADALRARPVVVGSAA